MTKLTRREVWRRKLTEGGYVLIVSAVVPATVAERDSLLTWDGALAEVGSLCFNSYMVGPRGGVNPVGLFSVTPAELAEIQLTVDHYVKAVTAEEAR